MSGKIRKRSNTDGDRRCRLQRCLFTVSCLDNIYTLQLLKTLQDFPQAWPGLSWLRWSWCDKCEHWRISSADWPPPSAPWAWGRAPGGWWCCSGPSALRCPPSGCIPPPSCPSRSLSTAWSFCLQNGKWTPKLFLKKCYHLWTEGSVQDFSVLATGFC